MNGTCDGSQAPVEAVGALHPQDALGFKSLSLIDAELAQELLNCETFPHMTGSSHVQLQLTDPETFGYEGSRN